VYLKEGKPRDDPEGYRAVALESCGLKFMTLLIHKCLKMWCERQNIVPPSQNGFREGHRTNDNVFILRTAIKRAKADGKALYVAFPDARSASAVECGAHGPGPSYLRLPDLACNLIISSFILSTIM
jgi:hypothetical protein